jgi:hypothetical protein
MTSVPGPSDVPRTTVEHAADFALDSVESYLLRDGAKPVRVFVAIHAADVPPGELDCTTAGYGYEDARDLLAELLTHASGCAKALGLTVHVIPVERGGEG